MFVTSIAWAISTATLVFLVMSVAAGSMPGLARSRRGALISIAAAISTAVAAEMAAPEVLAAVVLPMVYALILGLTAVIVAGVRMRRRERFAGDGDAATSRFWSSVTEAITTSESLDRMLMAVAAAMRRATGADEALVFKLTNNGRDVIYVGSAEGTVREPYTAAEMEGLSALARRSLADGRVAEISRGENADPHAAGAWGLIPLRTQSDVCGAVLLRDPRATLGHAPVAQILSSAGMLTGQAVEDWLAGTQGDRAVALLTRVSGLLTELKQETSFERGLPRLAEAIKGLVDADFLAIAWLDRARYHEDRACMVIGERRILDNRRRWPIWESTTRRLLRMTRPLITPDLEMLPTEDDGFAQPLEQRLGYKSRIVVPVRDGGRLLGSITLAHRDRLRFGEAEARPLITIANAVAVWLKKLEADRDVRSYRSSAALALRFEADPMVWTTDADLLKVVLGGVEATGLRLYRLTPDKSSLSLIASAGRTPESGMEKPSSDGAVPLTDVPWHRWAMTAGVPRHVDQSDPEALMGDDEVNAAMIPHMKTGWIVPIRIDDQTIGFLDAMEVRDPDRRALGEPERLLLVSAARAYAVRWRRSLATTTAPGGEQGMLRRRLSHLNGSVVNPITGIIGSVELIRHKQDGLTTETMRYLNLIEQSATRIHEAILGALDDAPRTNDDTRGQRSEDMARRLFGALSLPAASRMDSPARRDVQMAGVTEAFKTER